MNDNGPDFYLSGGASETLSMFFWEIEERIRAILVVSRRGDSGNICQFVDGLIEDDFDKENIPHSEMNERELRAILVALQLAKRDL